MNKLILAVAIGVAACNTPEEEAAPRADIVETASDSTAIAPDSVRGEGGRRAAPPTQFDARKVKVGDRIGGLTVADVQLFQVDNPPGIPGVQVNSPGVSGSVRFSGEAEITGTYRAHFDYPEVKEPCFWLDFESLAKLPRAQGDERLLWFCFENDDVAVQQLGALGTQSHATIVIDNYTTNLQQSDVWDTARLVRVVKKEAWQ